MILLDKKFKSKKTKGSADTITFVGQNLKRH